MADFCKELRGTDVLDAYLAGKLSLRDPSKCKMRFFETPELRDAWCRGRTAAENAAKEGAEHPRGTSSLNAVYEGPRAGRAGRAGEVRWFQTSEIGVTGLVSVRNYFGVAFVLRQLIHKPDGSGMEWVDVSTDID